MVLMLSGKQVNGRKGQMIRMLPINLEKCGVQKVRYRRGICGVHIWNIDLKDCR